MVCEGEDAITCGVIDLNEYEGVPARELFDQLMVEDDLISLLIIRRILAERMTAAGTDDVYRFIGDDITGTSATDATTA